MLPCCAPRPTPPSCAPRRTHARPPTPIGSAAKRLKEAEAAASTQHAGVVSYDVGRRATQLGDSSAMAAAYDVHYHGALPTIAFQPAGGATACLYHPYSQPLRGWCKEQDHAVIAAAHSLQELHHLKLGAGAHDFFSAGQAAAAMHDGLGSVDNTSLEHSIGCNSVVYNGVAGDGNGGYMMPMGAATATTAAMVSHEQVHTRAQVDHDEDKQAYERYLVNEENYGWVFL